MDRKGRALIGYMPREPAIQLLNGSTQPTPEQSAGLAAEWSKYVVRVRERDEFRSRTPIVSDLPLTVKRALKAVAARPDLQATFAPNTWEVGVVDLSIPVLTYQTLIQTDDAVQRIGKVLDHDWDSLIDLCLPAQAQVEIEGGFDQSQNAFTLSSPNPNLRIAGFQAVDVAGSRSDVPPQKVFGFTVGLGSSSVQFAEYQGRWMVRDGHHRLYGLLAAGVSKVPAVLIRAKTFEETGGGRPGFFGYELLFGQRPPQFRDFVSDEFSAEVRVRAIRKVVRIRAEEFAILS